jgi:hypothetical protein
VAGRRPGRQVQVRLNAEHLGSLGEGLADQADQKESPGPPVEPPFRDVVESVARAALTVDQQETLVDLELAQGRVQRGLRACAAPNAARKAIMPQR